MTAVTDSGYQIRVDDDPYCYRIVAVDRRGVQICGAYRPRQLNDWRVFVCKPVIDVAGMLVQPHKVHVCSREDAIRWIDLLATLYTRAVTA